MNAPPLARGLNQPDPQRQVFAETLGQAKPARRMEGRAVFVMGAGQRPVPDEPPPTGNGRAISILCAREGAVVACADHDLAAAAATVELIEKEGGRAHAFQLEASDPAEIDSVIAAATQQMGHLDGLVCNVGIGGPLGLQNQVADAWDEVLAVNLRSHMFACKAALPLMAPGGSIVFMSSTASLRPGTRCLAYDTSKAALAALCRHVALEAEALGIRANVIAPGPVDTPLGRDASRGRPARATQRLAFGREGTAWEVAQVTMFLLSHEASLINAQVIVADGGMTGLQLS